MSKLMQVEAGSIVRFDYKGIDVHDPRPLVLVLNPRWDKHLHGLNINYLTLGLVYNLYKLVTDTLSNKAKALVRSRLHLKSVSISNPYNFYHFRLKKFLRNKVRKSCYRTYTLTGISNVVIIDYKFGELSKHQQLKRAKLLLKKELLIKKKQLLKNKKILAAQRRQLLLHKKKLLIKQSKNIVKNNTKLSKLSKNVRLGK